MAPRFKVRPGAESLFDAGGAVGDASEPTLHENRRTLTDPPWILADGRCTTHAALRDRAMRAAEGFRARGIEEGGAVALLLGNGLPMLEASLAAGFAGAHPVPVDRHATVDDVAFILRDCGADLAVVESDVSSSLRHALPRGLALVDGAPEAWARWAGGFSPIAAPSQASRGATIYTSGTTGRPKGVRRAPAPAGRRPERALRVYGFDRPGRAVALIDGPLTHSVPNAYARMALGAGADIVLRRAADPEATLAAIARHRVTHLHVVPSMMARLLALSDAVKARHDLSSLRHVVHGAAPCPHHVRRAMVEWWGAVLHEYYGSTETGLLTFHGADEALAKPGSVGRALPGITLRILDPEGGSLPPGEVGTVYAASDTLHAFTYLGQAERRAAIGRGAFVTAGDLGHLDADGTLHLHDRARDVVHGPGGPVYTTAIEAVLSALPGVGDCAVFGVAQSDGRELVHACVAPRPGHALDPAALRSALATQLPPAAVPVCVAVMERLPRADSGKMMKHLLRARFAQAHP